MSTAGTGEVRGAATAPRRGLSVYPTAPPRRLVELSLAAEAAGYQHLWFGDSQNIWREAYTTMGAVAAATDRIIVGTGVTNGVTRHRSVLASAWATLHELAGGRVAAGFGVGDSALRTIGAEPMKVAALDSMIGDLRALWRGAEAEEPGADGPYRLDWIGDGVHVPVYLAASGPRLLELAGRIADGVILLVGTDPGAIAAARGHLEAGARAVGRRVEDLDVVLWVPVALDDDPSAAKDRVRAHVARTVLRPVPAELSAEEQQAVDEIRRTYDYYAHMVPGSPHSKLVTDSLVDRFALAGTPEECAARLGELAELGVDEVAMIPFPDPEQPAEELLTEFARL